MTPAEFKLVRNSLRLRHADLAVALSQVREDLPPSVIKGWERAGSRGPSLDLIRFLADAEKAVDSLSLDVLKDAITVNGVADLPDRLGPDAVTDFAALLRHWPLSDEALQSLHASAWDRAFLRLRWGVAGDCAPSLVTMARQD